MTTKISIYHVRAGVPQRVKKGAEKRISKEMKRLGGSVAWVSDKSVCFEFPTTTAAEQFLAFAIASGADAERTTTE